LHVSPRKVTMTIVLVVFNHKQVIIDSFKHCTLTVATDGTEDLLVHYLKPKQPCAAGLDRLNKEVIIYVVLQERQDPSETSEGLTHTYYKKHPIISNHDLEKFK